MQHSMDYIKQNRNRLTNIIKNCQKTQQQLVQLKKTLDQEKLLSQLKRQLTVKQQKFVSLLKASSFHVDEFERKQKNMASFQLKGDFRMRNELLGIETEKMEVPKRNRERFKKINMTVKTQGLLDAIEEKPQNQAVSAPLTPNTSKQKPQKNYFPRIQFIYQQTFSPKNASLSQQSLAIKHLEHSVHKKLYEQRCKKYNKENMMKEYERKKHMKDKKLEEYRSSILKKISYENVKKYLFSKMQKKEIIIQAEREQNALYQSFVERA